MHVRARAGYRVRQRRQRVSRSILGLEAGGPPTAQLRHDPIVGVVDETAVLEAEAVAVPRALQRPIRADGRLAQRPAHVRADLAEHAQRVALGHDDDLAALAEISDVDDAAAQPGQVDRARIEGLRRSGRLLGRPDAHRTVLGAPAHRSAWMSIEPPSMRTSGTRSSRSSNGTSAGSSCPGMAGCTKSKYITEKRRKPISVSTRLIARRVKAISSGDPP